MDNLNEIKETLKDMFKAAITNAKDGDEKGRWVTIKGTHVFIPEGKQIEDVMREKGWIEDGKKEDEPVKLDVADKPTKVAKEAIDRERQRTQRIAEEHKKEYEKSKNIDLTKLKLDKKDKSEKKEQKNHTAKSYYEQEYEEALKEIAEGRDYAQINFNTDISSMKMALAHLKRYDSDWDEYDVYENIKEYEDLSDDWNKEQIGRIAREKAAQETLKKWISEGKDRKNEYYKIYEPHKVKNEKETTILNGIKNILQNCKQPLTKKDIQVLNGLKSIINSLGE